MHFFAKEDEVFGLQSSKEIDRVKCKLLFTPGRLNDVQNF